MAKYSMRQIIEIKNGNTKTLRINYDLGNICNYKCWYCFPGSNEGTVPWPDADLVKHNIVALVAYYQQQGFEVQLSLLGGEPTLWPKLGEFVEYVVTKTNCKTYVITNGSRTLRWWDEYGQYFDTVTVSIHHQKADIDHLSALAALLNKKRVAFFFDMLMDHTAWYKCVNLVNNLKALKERFVLFAKPININGVESYSKVQKDYLRDSFKKFPSISFILRNFKRFFKFFFNPITLKFSNGDTIRTFNENYFSLHLLNRFKGWECTIGVNTIFIDRQGKLTGACGNLLYGLDFYYNINDQNFPTVFTPTLKPTICQQEMCLCPGEAALSKRKRY